MEYRATFTSNLGLVILALPLCGFIIATGVTHNEIGMVILGIGPLAWLLAIRLRLRVIVGDNYIEYTGLFSTKRIKISDITESCWMVKLGYPTDRFYGPYTYRIRTPHQSLKINFKFFPLECMRDVRGKLEQVECQR